MAMFAELYRLDERPGSPSARSALLAGAVPLPKHIVWAIRHRGPAARRCFGRSYVSQASDMLRAWWATGLAPRDYYHALLARHRGSRALGCYLRIHMLDQIVIELQFDRYGPPSFRVNDKGEFSRWAAAAGIPTPTTVVIATGETLDVDEIDSLGDDLIVKPRENALGQRVERWVRTEEGSWVSGDRDLSSVELIGWLVQRATAERPGVVVQERVGNHREVVEIVGDGVSTCRVVTLRNEHDEPEVVQFIWRTPGPDAIIDNFNGGGIHWGSSDFEHGLVVHGVSRDTGVEQVTHTRHPQTSAEMAGRAHPRWSEVRDLAMRGHRALEDVLLVGWDIATTPTGPVAIELNIPPGSYPDTQMVTDGLGRSRFGEILGWHARRWIERHVAKSSRRRVGASMGR